MGRKRREMVEGLILTCSACAYLDHQDGMTFDSQISGCLTSVLRVLVKTVDGNDSGEETDGWCQQIRGIRSGSTNSTALSVLIRIASVYHQPRSQAGLIQAGGLASSPAATTSKTFDILSQDATGDGDVESNTNANRMDIMCLALALLTSLLSDADKRVRSLLFITSEFCFTYLTVTLLSVASIVSPPDE